MAEPADDPTSLDTMPMFTFASVRDMNVDSDGWDEYRKQLPILATRIDGRFQVETLHGVVVCDDGWLAVDSQGFPYPIAAAEFEKVYEPVAG